MDDGLQNPFLIKDFSILVIDGVYGFGNGFVMPSGPLREKIVPGISKADLVIIIGEDKFNVAATCKDLGKKVILSKIVPTNYKKFKKNLVLKFTEAI